MEFGIPKEVRDLESRVGLTPAGVSSLVRRGHTEPAQEVRVRSRRAAGEADKGRQVRAGRVTPYSHPIHVEPEVERIVADIAQGGDEIAHHVIGGSFTNEPVVRRRDRNAGIDESLEELLLSPLEGYQPPIPLRPPTAVKPT